MYLHTRPVTVSLEGSSQNNVLIDAQAGSSLGWRTKKKLRVVLHRLGRASACGTDGDSMQPDAM